MTIAHRACNNGWPGHCARSLVLKSRALIPTRCLTAWRPQSSHTDPFHHITRGSRPTVTYRQNEDGKRPGTRPQGNHHDRGEGATLEISNDRQPFRSLSAALKRAEAVGIAPAQSRGIHDPILAGLDPRHSLTGSAQSSTNGVVPLAILPTALHSENSDDSHEHLEARLAQSIMATVGKAGSGRDGRNRDGSVRKDHEHELELSKEDRESLQGDSEEVAIRALLAESSELAAKLMHRLCHAESLQQSSQSDFDILFILRHVLNRKFINRKALQILIDSVLYISAKRKQDCVLTGVSKDKFGPPDILAGYTHLYSVFLLLHRLIWHACLIWPESLETISRCWTSIVDEFSRAHPATDELEEHHQAVFLSALYNSLILGLAKRHASEPFKYAGHQEAAQAHLLHQMATKTNPLDIDRAGYRGVLLVQLAHKKTASENAWAELKSPAWPPWKESRTAMDELIDRSEHGVSRAARILHRMQEAGFAFEAFEQTAQIYTGWDTDQSPTIQTRSITPGFKKKVSDADIWAARIRCTRTVREAWACFLAYQDVIQVPDQEVYLAMFEKLHYRTLTREQSDDTTTDGRILPGDSKEVWPSPASSHQETFTATPVPSLQQFYDQLQQKHVKLDGRFLAYFVANAPSYDSGWSLIKSNLPNMIQHWPHQQWFDRNEEPLQFMAAFIKFWTRFPKQVMKDPFFDQFSIDRLHREDWTLDRKQPLVIAYNLLLDYLPPFMVAYNALLEPLATNVRLRLLDIANPNKKNKEACTQLEFLVAFSLAKHIYIHVTRLDMSLDANGFGHFCTIISRAATAVLDIQSPRSVDSSSPSADKAKADTEYAVSPDDERVARTSRNLGHMGHFLGQALSRLVGEDISNISDKPDLTAFTSSEDDLVLPRLLFLPGPSLLHSYIRALGTLKKHEMILQLFNWIRARWPELRERRDEQPSGKVMFRRTMVSARMFLQLGYDAGRRGLNEEFFDCLEREEKGDTEFGDGGEGEEWSWAASRKTVRKIKAVVESMEDEWGAWPSAVEVLEYVERGKMDVR